MILPPVLILGAHLIMPVSDSVPALNVDQVCQGIAQQGGVSFHDTDIAEEKKNCLDSEKAMRDELAKEWSSFTPADKVACTNELKMGGEFELHRAAHLPGDGARRAYPECRRSQAGRRARNTCSTRPRAAEALAEKRRTRQFEKAFRLSRIFSENRCPLFGIML